MNDSGLERPYCQRAVEGLGGRLAVELCGLPFIPSLVLTDASKS